MKHKFAFSSSAVSPFQQCTEAWIYSQFVTIHIFLDDTIHLDYIVTSWNFRQSLLDESIKILAFITALFLPEHTFRLL